MDVYVYIYIIYIDKTNKSGETNWMSTSMLTAICSTQLEHVLDVNENRKATIYIDLYIYIQIHINNIYLYIYNIMYIQYVNPHTAFPNDLVCLFRWFTNGTWLQFAAVWWRYPSLFSSSMGLRWVYDGLWNADLNHQEAKNSWGLLGPTILPFISLTSAGFVFPCHY